MRNRLKVEGVVRNARAYLALRAELGSFDGFLWSFVGGEPRQNARQRMKDVPPRTPESDALSRALQKRGFTFVGSTICYAFMQAAGLVNDHVVDCFRHAELARGHSGPRAAARPERPGTQSDHRHPKGARMSSGRSSIVGASVWMLVISLLLFWLPFVGPLLGGVVGGRKAGGVGRAILAALVPAFVSAVLLFVLATLLTAMPLIGAVAAAGGFVLVAAQVGPMILGAILGGLMS